MDSLTQFLAIWGAVVSTIAIGWNILRDLRDRGRLQVFCYVGEVVGGAGPPDPRPKLVYKVTNAGRKPIVVTHIGGELQNGNHFMVNTREPMPKALQPGEFYLDFAEDLRILDQSPIALWAIDSLGKHWRVPRKQLRYLLREHGKKVTQRR